MNFEQYRPLALRTAKMFPTKREDMRHAVLGLITEIGEFATEVKRHVIYGKPLTDEMKAHMREELGDANWYVPLALLALGMESLPDISTRDQAELANYVELADLALMLNLMSATISGYVVEPKSSDRYEIAGYLLMIVMCIDKAALLLDTTGDQLRAENIAKLRLRYPDKYSDEAAEARADKGGLPASAS